MVYKQVENRKIRCEGSLIEEVAVLVPLQLFSGG